MVNNEPVHSRINNETLERIRKNYSPAPSIRVQRTASAKRNYYQPHNENQLEPLVETSAQSLCDASDLSFDDDSRLVLYKAIMIQSVFFNLGIFEKLF